MLSNRKEDAHLEDAVGRGTGINKVSFPSQVRTALFSPLNPVRFTQCSGENPAVPFAAEGLAGLCWLDRTPSFSVCVQYFKTRRKQSSPSVLSSSVSLRRFPLSSRSALCAQLRVLPSHGATRTHSSDPSAGGTAKPLGFSFQFLRRWFYFILFYF